MLLCAGKPQGLRLCFLWDLLESLNCTLPRFMAKHVQMGNLRLQAMEVQASEPALLGRMMGDSSLLRLIVKL